MKKLIRTLIIMILVLSALCAANFIDSLDRWNKNFEYNEIHVFLEQTNSNIKVTMFGVKEKTENIDGIIQDFAGFQNNYATFFIMLNDHYKNKAKLDFNDGIFFVDSKGSTYPLEGLYVKNNKDAVIKASARSIKLGDKKIDPFYIKKINVNNIIAMIIITEEPAKNIESILSAGLNNGHSSPARTGHFANYIPVKLKKISKDKYQLYFDAVNSDSKRLDSVMSCCLYNFSKSQSRRSIVDYFFNK